MVCEKICRNSKGICIVFDFSKLFGVVGGEVIDEAKLPIVDFANDDFKTKHKNLFLRKKWVFEKEYRAEITDLVKRINTLMQQ